MTSFVVAEREAVGARESATNNLREQKNREMAEEGARGGRRKEKKEREGEEGGSRVTKNEMGGKRIQRL